MFILLDTYPEPSRSNDRTRALVAAQVLDVVSETASIVLVEVELATRVIVRVVCREWDTPEFHGFMRHSLVRDAVIARLVEARLCP